VILVTAEDAEYAKAVAAEMAADEFALREELQGEKLWDIPAVVQAAIDNEIDKPVILVDSADSPNAGACGDSATVLEYVLPYRDTLRTAFSCNDEAAVAKAYELGVGATADFVLGASLAPALSAPVEVNDCVVRSLHDGEFILGGPAERGQRRSLGRSAVLQAGQIFILVTERGQNNGDLQFYRGFGIEPTLCRLVDVKACSSFRAGYEPVSALICNSVTPGAAGPELQALPFRKVPAPFYPFQEITADMISAPVCHR
jgi:microcystin degradation protein MlrC